MLLSWLPPLDQSLGHDQVKLHRRPFLPCDSSWTWIRIFLANWRAKARVDDSMDAGAQEHLIGACRSQTASCLRSQGQTCRSTVVWCQYIVNLHGNWPPKRWFHLTTCILDLFWYLWCRTNWLQYKLNSQRSTVGYVTAHQQVGVKSMCHHDPVIKTSQLS